MHRPLTDFWRVGKGYAKKLEAIGIYTMGDIARCSIGKVGEYYNEALLYKLFGINVELLIDHAWGWEPCRISDIKAYRPETNCVSSGQVLQSPYAYDKARRVVREMAEAVALNLLEKHLVTDQVVNITSDAKEGQTFTGVVTKVSVVGTTSGGTTTYPVTVRIDDTDGLRPGMNVDAEIVLSSADGVLAIPSLAVNRGDTVLVTSDSPSAANALEQEAPEGYAYVQVTTGVSDDSYIEITSGLQEGDTVAYLRTASSGSGNMMMGGMPGGDMGGGMPGGGGGMPSGGPGGGGPGGGF